MEIRRAVKTLLELRPILEPWEPQSRGPRSLSKHVGCQETSVKVGLPGGLRLSGFPPAGDRVPRTPYLRGLTLSEQG